jgi:hypothetical protein
MPCAAMKNLCHIPAANRGTGRSGDFKLGIVKVSFSGLKFGHACRCRSLAALFLAVAKPHHAARPSLGSVAAFDLSSPLSLPSIRAKKFPETS